MKSQILSSKALEGIEMLRQEREAEMAILAKAVKRAEEIFAKHPEGMPERELIQMLNDQGFSWSAANTGVDELRSNGLAAKNWSTGMLTHR